MDLLAYASSSGAYVIVRKPFAKRGAKTLFCGIWTYIVKVRDF